MIERSFIFLDGVGDNTERRIWQMGIGGWHDYLDTERIPRISTERKCAHDDVLRRAIANMDCRNDAFFASLLPCKHHWRLFQRFRKDAVYLDIETTGHFQGNLTTMVGTYDGKEFNALIRGKDLSKESIESLFEGKKMIITFYGRGFDVPVLEQEFGVRLPKIHYDLCFSGKMIGYHGGLKRIERQLGICRAEEAQGLDGMDAVYLWRDYERRGDKDALERLIAYNREDVVNLERISEIFYAELENFHLCQR
ncbi:MAG TPA: ribonuclease H-like domain-containing protein [Candidatus Methanofastidiosa archaeon]|nr:ribonuclease H-like domain-containing protein [Candidatus Methanofastidiosa archaeon]